MEPSKGAVGQVQGDKAGHAGERARHCLGQVVQEVVGKIKTGEKVGDWEHILVQLGEVVMRQG